MKKLFTLLIASVMLLTLAACGEAQQTTPPAPEAGESAAPTEAAPAETPAEESAAVDSVPLKVGDSIENENFTMTFDAVEVVPEYVFSLGDNSTMSLFVEEGYQLLVIRGHMTNNGMSVVSTSNFVFSGAVNGDYMLDNNDVDMTFERNRMSEMDPYTDLNYVLAINIPNKLAEIFETVSLTIGFNEDLSIPSTVTSSDGSYSLDADCLYNFTGTVTTA